MITLAEQGMTVPAQALVQGCTGVLRCGHGGALSTHLNC